MLVIYAFGAFLFFKIFPAFAFSTGNTALAAAVMAIASAGLMVGGEFLVAKRLARWANNLFHGSGSGDFPDECVAIYLGTVAVSGAACYLIAYGFAQRFVDRALRGDDYWLFVFMVIAPPLAHITLRVLNVRQKVQEAIAQKALIDRASDKTRLSR